MAWARRRQDVAVGALLACLGVVLLMVGCDRTRPSSDAGSLLESLPISNEPISTAAQATRPASIPTTEPVCSAKRRP